MSIKVNKREGENFNSLFFRFKRKIRQSGVLLEARKRRYFQRPENKTKRRKSALHRVEKEQEIKKLKRYGNLRSRSRR